MVSNDDFQGRSIYLKMDLSLDMVHWNSPLDNNRSKVKNKEVALELSDTQGYIAIDKTRFLIVGIVVLMYPA